MICCNSSHVCKSNMSLYVWFRPSASDARFSQVVKEHLNAFFYTFIFTPIFPYKKKNFSNLPKRSVFLLYKAQVALHTPQKLQASELSTKGMPSFPILFSFFALYTLKNLFLIYIYIYFLDNLMWVLFHQLRFCDF